MDDAVKDTGIGKQSVTQKVMMIASVLLAVVAGFVFYFYLYGFKEVYEMMGARFPAWLLLLFDWGFVVASVPFLFLFGTLICFRRSQKIGTAMLGMVLPFVFLLAFLMWISLGVISHCWTIV